MDRQALLLYLQNVRDLEIAKYQIERSYDDSKDQTEQEISRCYTTAQHKNIPDFVDPGGGCIWLFCAIMAGISAVGILLGLFLVQQDPEQMPGFVFPLYIISVAMFGIPAWKWRPGQASEKLAYEEKVKEIKAYNARQDQRAIDGRLRVMRLKEIQKAKDARYRDAYQKVMDVLQRFYSMNILASQYRNLESVLYIYDYMSTSQATFNDTLIHEHMENGIQRLASKLDYMMDELNDIVYETRCIRDENRNNIRRTIDQNNNMLRQLENVAHTSQEAAQYAELAANYSKANAYFSQANYLK